MQGRHNVIDRHFDDPSTSEIYSSNTPSLLSNGTGYIEHQVSRMDTLAGIAIKYGVEVADIKRLNGLVTDLQMFAHKLLRIPLPGRHPPSPISSNGLSSVRMRQPLRTPPRHPHTNVLESLKSLDPNSTQRRVSSAMSLLQGYYGLKPSIIECRGSEMSTYRDSTEVKSSNAEVMPILCYPLSKPFPNRHRKSSLLSDSYLENGEFDEFIVPPDACESEPNTPNEKWTKINGKSTFHTPDLLLKEENHSFSLGRAGNGLALRPKSANRIVRTCDTEANLFNAIPTPDSLNNTPTMSGAGVRKSSSTSSLQDSENNGSSIWPTSSKRALLPDLQAISTSSITKPIFDGLPLPMPGRKSKAAQD